MMMNLFKMLIFSNPRGLRGFLIPRTSAINRALWTFGLIIPHQPRRTSAG
jgi:hypothetical protein